jgi:VIT1/CCC1 family predicted Fe2+/Mn2+ transporter
VDELLKKAYEFYIDESTDSVVYRYLSSMETDPELKKEFLRLSQVEAGHAVFWREFLERRGVKVGPIQASRFKVWYAKLLRRLFGPGITVSLLEMGEMQAVLKYYEYLRQAGDLTDEERKRLQRLIYEEIEHEKILSSEKKRFHTENIRDFVLGMNDGLVEILGAVFGLSAVYPNKPYLVGFSGLIVGVAGALSMAVGTFISVRSQRQVNEALRRVMEIMLEVAPDEVAQRQMERLVEEGIPEDVAREVMELLKERGMLRALVPQPPDDNEFRAGLYTGLAYLFGVMFSVVPFFLAPSSSVALAFAVVLASLALVSVGSIVALFSGIDMKKKALEMLLSGLGAALISYGFGSLMNLLFGVSSL